MSTLSTSTFYKDQVLPAFRYQVTEDEMISVIDPVGNTSPAKVDGKRLVLPSKKWLKSGFGTDYIAFHPLAESMSRLGTSPVLQHMQRQVKANLAFMVRYLCQELMKVATDPSVHKDLPPDCTDFLKKLSDAQPATADWLEKVFNAANRKNRFVSVYLKANGKFDGKNVNRLCVIRFPILEEIQKEEDVFGLNIPKKHKKVIINLLKLIIPFGDSPEEYSAGTTLRTAPYFIVLIQAYSKITQQLNNIINQYRLIIEDVIQPYPTIDLSLIEKFDVMKREIPELDGNAGGLNEVVEEATETNNPVAAIPENVNTVKVINNQPVVAPVANTVAPTRQVQEAPATQGPRKITMADLNNSQQQMQAQMVNQFGQYPQMQQPMQMGMMPGMNPMMFQQPQPQTRHPQMALLMQNQNAMMQQQMPTGFAAAVSPAFNGGVQPQMQPQMFGQQPQPFMQPMGMQTPVRML